MKIIDKKSLIVSEIEQYKISEMLNTHYIYTGVDLDPEIYPDKYRKSATLEGTIDVNVNNRTFTLDNCTAVVMMNQSEKDAVDAEIAYKQRKSEFHNKRIKISIENKHAVSQYLALTVLLNSDSSVLQIQEKQYDINPQGDVTKVTKIKALYMDMIEQELYDDIKNDPKVIIEILDNDSIETVLPDGSYKYLIPQVT